MGLHACYCCYVVIVIVGIVVIVVIVIVMVLPCLPALACLPARLPACLPVNLIRSHFGRSSNASANTGAAEGTEPGPSLRLTGWQSSRPLHGCLLHGHRAPTNPTSGNRVPRVVRTVGAPLARWIPFDGRCVGRKRQVCLACSHPGSLGGV